MATSKAPNVSKNNVEKVGDVNIDSPEKATDIENILDSENGKDQIKNSLESIKKYIECETKAGKIMLFGIFLIALIEASSYFVIETSVKLFTVLNTTELIIAFGYFVYRSYTLGNITCFATKSISVLLILAQILTIIGMLLPISYIAYIQIVSPVIICLCLVLILAAYKKLFKK